MSLQKLRIKKSMNSEAFSRNPIINTLIRNKLQTQIVTVKDSVKNIIKKQSSQHNVAHQTQGRLRRQKSFTLTPKKINQSLRYDPVQRVRNYVQQFIALRQIQSYLLPKQQLMTINKARQTPEGLSVKFSKSDQLKYQVPDNMVDMSNNIMAQTIKQFKQDAWITGKPQITHMIEDRFELIQERNTSEKGILNYDRFAEQSHKFRNSLLLKPASSSSGRLEPLKTPLSYYRSSAKADQSLIPTQYPTKRYHKQDYKALQSWVQQCLRNIPENCQRSQANKPQQLCSQLNIIYSVYIAAWKQIIRLTYIQSYEKALLIEKMHYSMIRLFGAIITQQRVTAHQYHQQSLKEMKQVKLMLQQRCEKLGLKYQQHKYEIEELKNKNYQLSKGFIAYEKVNKQLVKEVETLTHDNKNNETSFNQINKAYVRALQNLYDQGFIELDYDKLDQNQKLLKNRKNNKVSYRTYYMIGKDNKPMTLGRFKYFEAGHSQFNQIQDQLQSIASGHLSKYGRKIQELQNQINRFWSKKQDDLQLKGTINSCLINIKVSDYATATIETQPVNFGCQFPQNSENYIEKLLLQQKLSLEKQYKNQVSLLQTQLHQKDILLQKWISSNELNVEKIKSLQQTIHNLQDSLKKQKQASNSLNKQLKSSSNLILEQQSEIQNLQNAKKSSQIQVQLIKNRVSKLQGQTIKLNKDYLREKQNNSMLVRANLQSKQNAQKQKIRHDRLKQKIVGVAPFLQRLINQIQRLAKHHEDNRDQQQRQLQQQHGKTITHIDIDIDMGLLTTVQQKIQQYLGDYVVRDSGLFMTKI